MTRKQLPRRAFLRGIGAAVALPALDAMVPAFASPGVKTALRMVFVYVPNGIIMGHWTPSSLGTSFDLPRLLEPLSPYRSDLLVLSGLAHVNGRALGDGPGDHARAAATFLTGVHPRKTAGADILAGISVDQVAAAAVGSATRFASLELGCEDGRQVGNCDSGYSCAYSNSIAWKTPTTPLPPEINPRLLFERLFGAADTGETAGERAKRARYQRSILDLVLEDTARLRGGLGPTDRRKLDEYLTAVREIETRIERAEREAHDAPSIDKPSGVPVEFREHIRLMFDLLTLALQADLTRVATFMVGREGSGRSYRDIGVPEAHHPLTHHRNDAEMMEKVAKINRYHVELFADFVAKLRSVEDGDGTLLDHSMVVYGSSLSDGNRHHHHDLPVLVLGRGAGAFKTGRHVRCQYETPLTNLFLTMLDRMGVHPEKLGDSTGRVEDLSELPGVG